MQELSSQQPPRAELSFQDRLYIIQTMNGLPPAQFEELCFALNPPKGVVPPNSAPQGERTKTLLDWAEGPTGPGLMAVDQGLQLFVPKITQPEQSPNPIAFAVSGKMGDLSSEELKAIVQLLRQKTGDDSIELAFITNGSIKLVLDGSPEGLEKLQELFDSGELTNVLEGRSVEYVHSVESDTTEARKARLLQVLRSERAKGVLSLALDRALALARDRDRDLDRDIAIARALDIDLARDRDRDIARDRDLARDLDRDIARTIARDIARALDIDLDLDIARDRALDRALDIVLDLVLDIALDIDLDIDRDLDRDLDRALDLARDLDRALALDRARDRDINLSNADLSGTNLRGLDLRGISLEKADLTGADVNGTLFGDNPGLAEASKRDLQQRGAIFQDPPRSTKF